MRFFATPPTSLRSATSPYTGEALRCGGTLNKKSLQPQRLQAFFFLVETRGLEPMTSRV